jgi:hypothetical protein
MDVLCVYGNLLHFPHDVGRYRDMVARLYAQARQPWLEVFSPMRLEQSNRLHSTVRRI